MPSQFTVTVERIIPGGRGLAFHEGKAVFVPLAAAGDRVLVRQFKDRKSYLEVLDREVLEPSPERTTPPCPYFGTCGGCDLQHLNYNAQLSTKKEILLDALRRVGKIVLLPSQVRTHPSSPLEYRNRLQLKLLQSSQGISWGFYKASTHEICAIDRCLIASPELWRKLEELRHGIQAFPPILQQVHEIEVLLGDNQELLANFSLLDAKPDLQTLASEFVVASRLREHPEFHIALSTTSGESVIASGRGFVWKTVGQLSYRVSHGSFFQVNEPMLLTLRNVGTQGSSGRKALELFCGIGFFTLALAQEFEVVRVVEANPSAVADLRHNLQLNHLENVEVIQQDLRTLSENCKALNRQADFLLIDPPRAGLPRETVEAVASLGIRQFVYVSCDPSTLARDLRILRACQYEIEGLDLLDLFPQSHHLETVAHLKKC